VSKLRTAMIALAAVASIGIVVPQAASARGGGFGGGHGGFGGGGFHGGFGGFHGGAFHGGGFHGGWGGFHRGYGFGPGLAAGAALGWGLYGPYGYGGYYPYYDYDDYPAAGYYDDGNYGGGCMIIHRRVHTRHGWSYRIVHVCE
jgi:hypothetical protein